MQDVYFFWMYFSVIVAVSDPPGSLQWTFNFQELKRWSSWRKLPWIYARFSELVEHCLFCFEINGGVCWLKSAWEWFLLWSVCSWKINISWYQIFWIREVFPSGLCRGVGRTYPGKQLLLKKTDHPLFDQILLRTYRQSVRSNSHELFLMLKNAQELIKCTN